MSAPQVIEADLTWTGETFESGVRIQVDAAGRIERAGRLSQGPTRRLHGQALLPGLINAHSHAFQRGLRGQGERFPDGAGSFWTWREAMYRLVSSLDAAAFRHVVLQAFREMLDAGITTVAEFHYLHHSPGNSDYAFDELVLDAAREAGIRLVLLNTYYRTGGIGRPLGSAQRRFGSASAEGYWEQMDRLAARLRPGQTLGAVVHSIRAASVEDLAAIHGEAKRRGLVFHMHVEEQPREIEECRAAYGRAPMALVNETLNVGPEFTAVHCTHTDPDQLAEFLEAGGRVCVCPLTEANLGDGVRELGHPPALRTHLCLGTDSNARIAMLEEMRWLEYGQRVKCQGRGILADESGRVAHVLLDAATIGGAAALGVEAGRAAPGAWADFFSVDLTAPALADRDADTLLDALVFGAGNEVIRATCVGGVWRETRSTASLRLDQPPGAGTPTRRRDPRP